MSDRRTDAMASMSRGRLQTTPTARVLMPVALGVMLLTTHERALAQGVAPPAASAAALPAQQAPVPSTQVPQIPSPPPAQPIDAWTPAEIAEGIAQCQKLLSKSDVVATPVPPFKSGDCGSPAAVELVSIGRNPAIRLEPAVVVTCELAATLATWAKAELQPLAQRHLGHPITRIDTMSSYSCRNAYGRKKSRLSEHGRANAIDIRSFVTRGNDEVSVLADWGPSERKIAAMIAAAKAAEAKRAQAIAAAKTATPPSGTVAPSAPPPATTATIPDPRGKMALSAPPEPAAAPPSRSQVEAGTIALPRLRTIIEGLPGVGQKVPSLTRPAENMGLGQPSYLGGAKEKTGALAKPVDHNPGTPPPTNRKQVFIKAVHASACRTFGTVLGPEANAAHENHFHFDMAERLNGNYCE